MKKHIAYLGPSGTYSEIALREHITADKITPCQSITEVFEKVDRREVDGGFVPFENVIGGPVAETMELLQKYKNSISVEGSYQTGVIHALGVRPKPGGFMRAPKVEEIKQVYSHPQALKQCSIYLRNNLPEAELCPTSSSAAAASAIIEKNLDTAGVIAARATLQQYGFRIVADDIADEKDNATRFILITPS